MCLLLTFAGVDIRSGVSYLPADGDARFSDQSAGGDVYDQDRLFLAGRRPSCSIYSLCKLSSHASNPAEKLWIHTVIQGALCFSGKPAAEGLELSCGEYRADDC